MDKQPIIFKHKLSLLYLWFVPLVTAIIGFGIGPVSYKLYLPIWALNAGLMIAATYYAGLRRFREQDQYSRQHLVAALLLIIPWLMFSIFAGMGRPPATIAGWANTASEQQIRYTTLIAGGISALLGMALLKTRLQAAGENLYSILAYTAMSIAIPLFIINMAYWGYYLTDAFRLFTNSPGAKRPDWHITFKNFFYVISVTEVALTYLATLLFAASLKTAGLLNRVAFRWYLGLSLLGIFLDMTPSYWPEPFGTAGFLVAVPAFPFIMPYLIGVNLLKLNKC